MASSSEGVDEAERDNFPAAMNQSIYLMLAVPYGSLIIFGYLIYRGMKKNEEYRAQQQQRASV